MPAWIIKAGRIIVSPFVCCQYLLATRAARPLGRFVYGVKTTIRLSLNWSSVQVARAMPRSSVGDTAYFYGPSVEA
jgi:hypothetical protein